MFGIELSGVAVSTALWLGMSFLAWFLLGLFFADNKQYVTGIFGLAVLSYWGLHFVGDAESFIGSGMGVRLQMIINGAFAAVCIQLFDKKWEFFIAKCLFIAFLMTFGVSWALHGVDAKEATKGYSRDR